MVKKSDTKNSDLLVLRKVGFGKTGVVDYRFIIGKDYIMRVEIGLSQELSSSAFSTCKVLMSEEEKDLVNKFVTRYVIPKRKDIPSFQDGQPEKYEREEIYFDDIVTDDEDLLDRFHSIIDYFQSEYSSISPELVAGMYRNVDNCVSVKK